jgi:hypothetical protein
MEWRRHRFIGADGKLRGGAQLFGLGTEATYVGTGYARNIHCDKWSHTNAFTRNGDNHTTVTVYYFAVPEWKLSGLDTHQTPIQ